MADLLRWKASHVSTPNQPVKFTEQQFVTQFGHPKITRTGKDVPTGVGELVLWEVEVSDGTTQFLVAAVTKESLDKQAGGMSKGNREYWEGRIGSCVLQEGQ